MHLMEKAKRLPGNTQSLAPETNHDRHSFSKEYTQSSPPRLSDDAFAAELNVNIQLESGHMRARCPTRLPMHIVKPSATAYAIVSLSLYL